MVTVRGTTQSFALMGAASATVPASIPFRSAEIGVPSSELMLAVPLLFLGLLFGILATPILSKLIGINKQVKAALISQALGVLLIGMASSPTFFVFSAFLLGFGFGQLEVLITSIMRQISEDVGKSLTRIGAFLSSAAFLVPLLLMFANSLKLAFLVNILIFMSSVYVAYIFTTPIFEVSSQNASLLKSKPTSVYFLLITSACYVGAETILSGWSAVFYENNVSSKAAIAPIGTSIFWFALTLGRLIGTWSANTGLSKKTIALLWSLGFSFALTALNFVSGKSEGTVFLPTFILAVMFAGPCYGFIIGHAVSFFEASQAVKSASLYVLVGAIGGVSIPLVVQIASKGNEQFVILGGAFSALLGTIFLLMSFQGRASINPQS